MGRIEARDQSSSRPLTMSASKSTLGLKGSERDSIVGYSPSSSPPHPCSLPKSTSNRKSSDLDENGQRLIKSGHARRGKREQKTSRPFRRFSLQGCSSVEVACEMRTRLRLRCVVCGSGRTHGDVRKGDERQVISLEEEEETMEEDRRGADERWWVVWRTLLLFCHLTAGGKAGESEEVEHER